MQAVWAHWMVVSQKAIEAGKAGVVHAGVEHFEGLFWAVSTPPIARVGAFF